MLERDPKRTTIVIVPTIVLKQQWEKKMKQWKVKNVSVYVINTVVINELNLESTLLVVDECHLSCSEEFIKIYSLIKRRFLLGLTATVNRLDGRHQLLLDICPIVDTITMAEAREKGWVADYLEFNLGLELNKEDRKRYDEINKKFKYYFSKFNHNFDLAMKCSNRKYAEERALEIGESDPKNVVLASLQFNKWMRERKDFLYKTQTKLDCCIEIINRFNLKTVVFSESTEFADQLTEMLGDKAVCYHSNLETKIIDGKKYGKKKLKDLAIKKFSDNRYKEKVLVTAKALNQGLDVEDVELVIIASYNRNPTTKKQRDGRGTRKYTYTSGIKKGTDKIAIVVNLYIKDSQDERWLKEAQKDPKTKKPSNPYVIEIESINEINYDVTCLSISATGEQDEIQ